jgi:opacity protein-like surface antigen
VRFDTGAVWLSDGTLNEVGTSMDTSIDDVEPLEFFSIGAGRYITPSLRAELAADLYTRGDVLDGQQNLTERVLFDATTVGAVGIDDTTYAIARQESVKFEQDTLMLNFYYDFRNSTRFTPYLGAGIGATYRQLTRKSSEIARCSSLTNLADPTRDDCVNADLNTQDELEIAETTSEARRWDVTGALMAGVAVQVSDDVLWDTGYRYMWQAGGLSVDSPAFNGANSRIEIKDVGQHQLRTGIRVNIN